MDLIDIYYELSEIFDDDIELIISAIRELTHTRYKRSNIREKLEGLNLNTLESELNQLYNMTVKELKAYRIKKVFYRKQTTIYDFM